MKNIKQAMERLLADPDRVKVMAKQCGITVDEAERYLMKWLDEGPSTDRDWEQVSMFLEETHKAIATRDIPPDEPMGKYLSKADKAKITRRVKARQAAARESDPDLN